MMPPSGHVAEGGAMPDGAPGARLTHQGALNVLRAAIAKA
jgi:hypothetical protein